MGTQTMGKVLVTAKLENLKDLMLVEEKQLSPDEVRSVEVAEAPVDTGATGLSIPRRLIDQLGLSPVRTRRARLVSGIAGHL